MRKFNHHELIKIFGCAAGAVVLTALAVFLFIERNLFFQASLLESVTKTTPVPFENQREGVFAFLIVLLVLMACDLLLHLPLVKRKAESRIGQTFKGMKSGTGMYSIFKKMLLFAAAIANAVWCFWLLELINNYYILDMKPKYVSLGIEITLVITLVFLLAANSVSAGMILANWFFLIWACVNYFVQQFRGIPFQWVDFSSARTAFSVAGNYSYTPNWQIVAGAIITCAISMIWLHIGAWHTFRSIFWKCASRAAAVILTVLFFFLMFKTSFLQDQGIWLRDWQPWYTYRLFGMEAGFLAFGKASYPEAPEDYSQEQVSKIIESYRDGRNDADGEPLSDASVPENIICIMNESYSDLTIYPNFRADTSLTDTVMNLRENAQSGKLLVSVKGGTTANSEYEFLTGNSCVLSPTTVVYNSFIKQDQYSIVKALEAQGYRSVAMHPYGQYGWNRNSVYPKMGFEEFLHKDNYFTGADKVRGLVSDKGDYQSLIDYIESKKPGEKLFVFNITMQNHSSYKSPNLTSTVKVENFSGKNLGQAEQYCTLLKMSDDAIGELLDYFRKSDEKTLVCFFGDHQPEIGDDFWEYCYGKDLNSLDFEEQQKQFETRWFIWANYQIPEKTDLTMSVNYLGSYLLELAGLKKTEYEDYLSEMREEIPAMNAYGYLGTDGKMHQWNSTSAGTSESMKLRDYLCLIYDELTGGAKRDGAFFGLQ